MSTPFLPDFSRISTPAGNIPADAPHWNAQRPSQMPSHRYRDVHSRVDVPRTERYSGTHQDAIRKGFAEHRARAAAEGRDATGVEASPAQLRALLAEAYPEYADLSRTHRDGVDRDGSARSAPALSVR